MKNNIEQSGKTRNWRFHKVKKHVDIIKKRLAFKRQKNTIEKIDNGLLNIILKSIIAVKYGKYNDDDQKVFQDIESYRQELLNNSTEVSYEIFNSSETKQIKDICRIAASPKVWGQLLYFITKYSKSKKVLEIGTNVGISGTYILNGMKQHSDKFKFITMEGLDQLCLHCEEHFSEIVGKDNFDIISGLYENTFPKLIGKEKGFDLLFIDGNHRKEPTLKYFEELKSCIADKAIFIFDDI